MRTAICGLFGIDIPIASAGMAGGSAGPALAAAVSEAGALGGLGGIVGDGPEGLRERIRTVRALTAKPFSVNLWVHLLGAAPGFFDVCIEERVPSITLSFGDPTSYVARAHEISALVVCQVQTVAGAKQAAAAGVDAIIAQGGEAGGHTGSVATMPLVPQVVDVAGTVPVLAAGGIADGRGLVAALALGAQGVVMGTRFVASAEATSPAIGHRERILAATADDTAFTDVFDVIDQLRWPDGIHGRTVRTPFVDEWYGREEELRAARAAIMAEAPAGETPLRAHSAYAGQSAGLVHDVKPAAAIIADIMREADAVLARLPAPSR
ncbi:MAG TPA: nitronate monooxygenase family protein [Dehalococcoidia bacterium]|nr:nitronate monooxygenase family protein [Dehalococcoidia bacterium]